MTDRADRAFRIILAAAAAGLAATAALAFLWGRPIWALDAAVIGLLLGAVFLLRRALNLTPLLFALVASIGLFHCAGVAGLYGMSFIGLEYDTYVHTWNTFVLGLAACRYMRKHAAGRVEAAVAALLIVLGLGLANELVEFAGDRIGGPGDGWFLTGAGDVGREDAYGNLMTDFANDFLGAAAGITVSTWALIPEARRRRRQAGGPRG